MLSATRELHRAQLRLGPARPRERRHAWRLAEPAVELPARHRRQRARRVGAPDAGRPSGRPGRDRRGGGHGDRLRQPRPLPALARPLEVPLRPRLGLRRRRPVPERRQRPRHPRRRHDRRGHRQHGRPDRARLRREADAGQGARPQRRGRLRRGSPGHPLGRRPRGEDHQPVLRVPVGYHALADPQHPRRDPPRGPRARSSSAPRATPRPPRSPTRRARATSSRSARRPSTPARPTTPTRARTSTSSPRAAAPTTPSTATRTAARPSRRASTSSR